MVSTGRVFSTQESNPSIAGVTLLDTSSGSLPLQPLRLLVLNNQIDVQRTDFATLDAWLVTHEHPGSQVRMLVTSG